MELSERPIAFAEEFGDMVIHFAADHSPVYSEVLNARALIKKGNAPVARA